MYVCVCLFVCLYTGVLVLPPLLTAPCEDLVTSHDVYVYACM